MKSGIISLFVFIICSSAYSQVQVGLKHDINGIPFNGYFDPLIYSPVNKITKVYSGSYGSYEFGYYFDKTGKKIKGLLKFDNNKIYFRNKSGDYGSLIEPGEINHLVLGVDSFFAIRKYYVKDRIKDKPEFVQYIASFDDLTFVKLYQFSNQSLISESFLVKQKDSLMWQNFPDNIKFKNQALKYFGHIPYLKEKISSGKYKSEDMLSIVKMAEYYHKFKNSQSIQFDKYWQETSDVNRAVYSASITSLRDSIWTFEYYKDSAKMFQADYSSFYPIIKNGLFISYYSDGKIRQTVFYKNDKPQETKVYSKSGLLHTQYKYIEKKKGNLSKTFTDIEYVQVLDSLGNNILMDKSKSRVEVMDEFNDKLYTGRFDKKQMISFYRLSGVDTIFQITERDYDFNVTSLQEDFDQFIGKKKVDDALRDNAHGIILVSLVIDEKGYPLESSILNKLHPDYDKLVESFIKDKIFIKAEYRYKLSPYKKAKVKRTSEVVIPFIFSVERFYRRSVYYHQNDAMWHMLHNPVHHQNVPLPKSIPGAF